MADRLQLILNATSGTGHAPALAGRLRALADGALGAERVEVAHVRDHPAAARAAGDFVARTRGRCAVVAGGGNGTLRAAVEGIVAAGGADRVAVAALRLGSGNPFARHFGVPADPEAALRGILANLAAGRLARCELLRCDVEDADGARRTLHGTSLVGLGALGRVPGDLARWHGAHPRARRALARLLGVERLTALEYAVAFALRATAEALRGRANRVRAIAGGRSGARRVAAAAVVKLDVPALPLRTGVRAGDPAMALALLEAMPPGALLRGLLSPRRLARRARVTVLGPGDAVRLERADGAPGAFFVDEDPETFGRALTIRLAGALAVVPGTGWTGPEPAVPEAA